jgi:hypothetical protein
MKIIKTASQVKLARKKKMTIHIDSKSITKTIRSSKILPIQTLSFITRLMIFIVDVVMIVIFKKYIKIIFYYCFKFVFSITI